MKLPLLALFMLCNSIASGQQTMGLMYYDSLSYNGYTLFSPMPYTATYLIDNCGREIHSWDLGFQPNYWTELLPNGELIHTYRLPTTPFTEGSVAGVIEKKDWEGNTIWSFENQDEELLMHHDFEVLPNGNIVVIAHKYMSYDEAIEQGRSPEFLGSFVAPLALIEYQPNDEGAVEVWRWESEDHMVQDYDETKANFGVVSEHPERIDFNYILPGSETNYDCHHTNSVQYNAELDQLVVSVRNFSELWIIDHSTTTEEAASSTGGNSGQGGDLLYRWGNPRAYDRGTAEDQQLFEQHDARWLEEGLPGEGNMLVFNNNLSLNSSSVLELVLPVNENGLYEIEDGEPFGPILPVWEHVEEGFYAPNVSGAQRLANGNTLICEGTYGRLFEVDPEGNTHWEYVNPVGSFGPMTQGVEATGNAVFRCWRYEEDFEGFSDQDLSPGAQIELEPLPTSCEIFVENPDTTIIDNLLESSLDDIQVRLLGRQIEISNLPVNSTIEIYSSLGQIKYSSTCMSEHQLISVEDWAKGQLIVRILNHNKLFIRRLILE